MIVPSANGWHSLDEANAHWLQHTAETIATKARKRKQYSGCQSYWLWIQDRETVWSSIDTVQIQSLMQIAANDLNAFDNVFIETTEHLNPDLAAVWRLTSGNIRKCLSGSLEPFFPKRSLEEIMKELEGLIAVEIDRIDSLWYLKAHAALHETSEFYGHRLPHLQDSSLTELNEFVRRLVPLIIDPIPLEEWKTLSKSMAPQIDEILATFAVEIRKSLRC